MRAASPRLVSSLAGQNDGGRAGSGVNAGGRKAPESLAFTTEANLTLSHYWRCPGGFAVIFVISSARSKRAWLEVTVPDRLAPLS